jgi:hypothetical protein
MLAKARQTAGQATGQAPPSGGGGGSAIPSGDDFAGTDDFVGTDDFDTDDVPEEVPAAPVPDDGGADENVIYGNDETKPLNTIDTEEKTLHKRSRISDVINGNINN